MQYSQTTYLLTFLAVGACLHRRVAAKPFQEGQQKASCRDPEDAELYKQYLATLTDLEIHESLFQVQPAVTVANENLTHIGLTHGGRPSNSSDDFSDSICPWRYVHKRSDLRFPRIFREAQITGDDPKLCNLTPPKANCICEALHFYTRILKRVDCVERNGHGNYTYQPSWQRITLGFIPVQT